MTINIKAYFFNQTLDYLPYYKIFILPVNENMKVEDILSIIREKDFHFEYPSMDTLYVKINGLIVDSSQSIKTIADKLGNDITIEPISLYRSSMGLGINDDDFMQSFELLREYASEEDLEFYKSLYAVHYASETFDYNNQYIGDAILVLAHKMISNENKYKDNILKAIGKHDAGLWECEYANNIFNGKDYSKEIGELKEMAKGAPSRYVSLFARKIKEKDFDGIDGRNVAFYAGTNRTSQDTAQSILDQIRSKGATPVKYDSMYKIAGQTLLDTNPRMAYLKMGTMLLDAMDSGADMLVVHNEEDAEIFKKSIGLCERVIQRDIKLDIIPRNKLMSISAS